MSDAEDFFLRQLPTRIASDLRRFGALRGRLAFSCAGSKFTVTLGELEQPVAPGFARDADVKVWFFGDAFQAFLRGEAPSSPKGYRLEGDPAVLSTFGQFLQPAHNALSVRFG